VAGAEARGAGDDHHAALGLQPGLGDPTHQWPPVSEFGWYYLEADWRAKNAPHTDASNWVDGYSCDFKATWGYALHPLLAGRNSDFQQMALNFAKEAAQDMHATLTTLKG
jgi:hypothetical protein